MRGSAPSERQESSQSPAAPELLCPPSEWLAWGPVTPTWVREIGKTPVDVLPATLWSHPWHGSVTPVFRPPPGVLWRFSLLCHLPVGRLCSESKHGHPEVHSKATVSRAWKGGLIRPRQGHRIHLWDLASQLSDKGWRLFLSDLGRKRKGSSCHSLHRDNRTLTRFSSVLWGSAWSIRKSKKASW